MQTAALLYFLSSIIFGFLGIFNPTPDSCFPCLVDREEHGNVLFYSFVEEHLLGILALLGRAAVGLQLPRMERGLGGNSGGWPPW